MKKYLLSIALLAAVATGAKAQFSLGVKGGVNFSKINTDNLKESTTAGYQVGIFSRIGNGIYLQPELYLGSKSGQFEFTSAGNTTVTSGKTTFTTLNVPLLLGESFGTKNLNFRIMAGPIYSYYLSRSDNFSTATLGNAYADFGKYNNSTLGFQAGAGIDIGAITADLRYEGGLSKVNDSYGQRPSIWALSVGFKIL